MRAGLIVRSSVVCIAAAAMLAACSSSTHGSFVSIDIADETHIVLNVLPCPDGSIATRVRATPTEVRILATYDANDDAKCSGFATVTLADPLGSRVVRDDHTGDLFAINTDARCKPKATGKRCDGIQAGTFPTAQP